MHYPECPECIELLRYDTIGSLKCGKFSWTVPGNIFSPIPIPSIQSCSSNSTLSPYLIHSSKRQTIAFYTKNLSAAKNLDLNSASAGSDKICMIL